MGNKGRYKGSPFRFAWNGIIKAVQNERNLRFHFAAAILALGVAYILPLTTTERAIIFLVVAMVITLELVNTAIEAVVDLVSPEHHELAAYAKDAAAGAVLVGAIFAVIIGLIIFLPPIITMIQLM